MLVYVFNTSNFCILRLCNSKSGEYNKKKYQMKMWLHAGGEVDCSQSPYFSVGFLRPVRFDGIAAILICKSERDLGRVSKLPRRAEVGVSIEVV